VRIESFDTLGGFLAAGNTAIAAALARRTLEAATQTDDIVYHSVLPWLSFRAFTNALPGGDSIPRIVFGKTSLDRRKATMPVSVEVHHALADGLDVARFLERFQARLEARI
jgi:chloramphenicol O-acetyltransferase type A